VVITCVTHPFVNNPTAMSNMAVRKAPSWFQQVDERVLEFLEKERKSTPMEMAESGLVTSNNSYISQRLRLLREIGLVKRPSQGLYRITDKGDRYLAGTEDLRDIEKPS